MQYGKKLSILRIVSQLTQNQIGNKLHITGSAYGKLEREKTALTADRAKQACGVFNCDVNWLMKEEKFSMLIQSDENGKLTVKVLNDETEINDTSLQQALQIIFTVLNKQQNEIQRLVKAVETNSPINNHHTGKNQRAVKKRKSSNTCICLLSLAP